MSQPPIMPGDRAKYRPSSSSVSLGLNSFAVVLRSAPGTSRGVSNGAVGEHRAAPPPSGAWSVVTAPHALTPTSNNTSLHHLVLIAGNTRTRDSGAPSAAPGGMPARSPGQRAEPDLRDPARGAGASRDS